jgi:uncharacterized protein (TIGR02444 family)
MKPVSETFWDFSVRTYRTEFVPEACLSLQDERGVDVNMLLFCCWYGVTRGRQEKEFFQHVFEFSENWAERVVRPLRNARTWMKLDGCIDPRMPTEICMEFREKVKGVEFSAEKIQQDVLESLTLSIEEKEQSLAEQLTVIKKNIRQYFDTVNIVLDDFVKERLVTIMQAGVVELSAADIRTALNSEN